jgi:hypothetical protein
MTIAEYIAKKQGFIDYENSKNEFERWKVWHIGAFVAIGFNSPKDLPTAEQFIKLSPVYTDDELEESAKERGLQGPWKDHSEEGGKK